MKHALIYLSKPRKRVQNILVLDSFFKQNLIINRPDFVVSFLINKRFSLFFIKKIIIINNNNNNNNNNSNLPGVMKTGLVNIL